MKLLVSFNNQVNISLNYVEIFFTKHFVHEAFYLKFCLALINAKNFIKKCRNLFYNAF